MASAAVQIPDNFFKVLDGIRYVICQALPSLDDFIRAWHANQICRKCLAPCLSPHMYPTEGEPTKISHFRFRRRQTTESDFHDLSCQNCIGWAKAMKSVLYSARKERFEIVWENIDTTRLYEDHIEVCNGFISCLPPGPRPTKMEDYDIGSILQIMRRFGDYHFQNFHTTNPEPHRVISQVSVSLHNIQCMQCTQWCTLGERGGGEALKSTCYKENNSSTI